MHGAVKDESSLNSGSRFQQINDDGFEDAPQRDEQVQADNVQGHLINLSGFDFCALQFISLQSVLGTGLQR